MEEDSLPLLRGGLATRSRMSYSGPSALLPLYYSRSHHTTSLDVPLSRGTELDGPRPGSVLQFGVHEGPEGLHLGSTRTEFSTAGFEDNDEDKVQWYDSLVDWVNNTRLMRWYDRFSAWLTNSTAWGLVFDVLDMVVYVFDTYTDIKVVVTFHDSHEAWWLALSVLFICWHYVIMAVLLCGYTRRTSGRYAWWEEEIRRSWAWLLFVPFSLPCVLLLDMMMVVTNLLPALAPHATTELSSFLSNYNFSRLFMEFVFESIPQTVLQTYIMGDLVVHDKATSKEISIVAISLFFSMVNVAKYSFRLWKAADSAGMTVPDYFKYLLLLKGNYICSFRVMQVQIDECCVLEDNVLHINGFQLHKSKARFGPAQQAYILMNSFGKFDGEGIRKLVVSGCPLPSINRILETGLTHCTQLKTLEISDCSFRGSNLSRVRHCICQHPSLETFRFIQTGVIKKYKNCKKDQVITLFKSKLPLTQIALCVPWWTAQLMERACRQMSSNTKLTSLALEYPVSRSSHAGTWEEVKLVKHHKAPGVNENLGLDYCWPLASLLLTHPTLKALYLHYHMFAQEAMTLLARTLQGTVKLELLSLKGSRVGDQGALELAQMLKVNSVLTHLNLRHCQIHDEGLKALSGALMDNRHLLHLDLSQNNVHASGAQELARALRTNQVLQVLKMEGWRDVLLGDEGQALQTLGGALGMNKGLKEISLAGTFLTDKGALALAPALSVHPQLTSLDLTLGENMGTDDYRMGDDGCAAVASALATSSTIVSLKLQDNRIAMRSASALASLLSSSTPLRSLNLGNTDLGSPCLMELAKGLQQNTTLRHLCLRRMTCLDVGGARALAEVLKAGQPPLVSLDLSCSRTPTEAEMSDTLWSNIAQALSVNTSLEKLNLAYMDITETGAMALGAALAKNNTLKHLDLSGYKVEDASRYFGHVCAGLSSLKEFLVTGRDHNIQNIVPRRPHADVTCHLLSDEDEAKGLTCHLLSEDHEAERRGAAGDRFDRSKLEVTGNLHSGNC